MSARIKRNAPLLKLLTKAKPGVVRGVIKDADKELIDSISECCLNVLSGRVRLTASQKAKLKKHKKIVRELAKRGVSARKRKALAQKGGFLGALLKPIVSALGGLFMS